jgi:hypothetical protein
MIKAQHMFKYFISFCFLFLGAKSFCQEIQQEKVPQKIKDTIVYKTNYGLRLGIDLSRPIKAYFSSSYSGLEITGDYRIRKNIYIATEFGFEKETSIEDYSNSTSKGNFIRVGFNYNAYKNWLDMNNEVFIGFRYGFSLFEQTLNNYTPNVSDAENGNYFPATIKTPSKAAANLNAHWSELMIGIKAETLKNVFIGISVSYKILISAKNPEDFQVLFAPGFNRIFESETGFGLNYTISYLIPFSKK